MSHANLVLAYHGCDITVRDDLVAGRTNITASKNPYDWLGSGIYFYEADPERALAHSSAVRDQPDRLLAKKAIANPAVVGVVLDVSVWLDMSTQVALKEFANAAETCLSGFASAGTQAPQNGPAFKGDADNLHRAFDRAAFDTLHGMRDVELRKAIADANLDRIAKLLPYQAVRSAFTQGDRLANNGSGFFTKNHTQIALRDATCIRGYFIPAGQPQLLAQDQRVLADAQLVEAQKVVTAQKPRIRAHS